MEGGTSGAIRKTHASKEAGSATRRDVAVVKASVTQRFGNFGGEVGRKCQLEVFSRSVEIVVEAQ